MNNDLISRSELKKAFNKWWGCDDIPATVVEDLIDNAPTVELTEEQAIDKLHETGWLIRHDKEMTERPHGEWIDHWNEGYVECPFCHKPITGGDLNYCVKCGADMRPEKKLQTPSCLTNPERQAELLGKGKKND